jgi:hypothetical protein
MQSGTVNMVSATSNQLVSYGSNQYGYDALGNTTTVNGTARYHTTPSIAWTAPRA